MEINKEEVESYLEEVRKAIRGGRYTVSPRGKNEQLFIDYVINEKERENILLDLSANDLCDMLHNQHEKYSHEILYVFGKTVRLTSRFKGNEVNVSLYIKINKIANGYCIVISFHEQQYSMKFVFK